MASFYLDHDVSSRLASLLRALGHQVTTTKDLNLAEAKYPSQLRAAVERGLILITHNRNDFALLHEAWHNWPPLWAAPRLPIHPGIIVIPQPLPTNIAPTIDAFVTRGLRLENQLHRWRPSDGWSRWDLGRTWQPLEG